MKRLSLLLTLLFFIGMAHAQKGTTTKTDKYAAIDKVALAIPESKTSNTKDIAAYITANFTKDGEKARAAFCWVVNNISYDVANMYALNFYENKEERIEKALATREGVCAHYADLFTDICNRAGLKAHTVEGCTKQNGYTEYVPHAWCVVNIDGKWNLLDPTWAAGYSNGGKFVKKVNESLYLVPAEKFIETHLPFDPMWQLSEYPYTYGAFYAGKQENATSNDYFSFADTIAAYEQLTPVARNEATVRRMERNGKVTSLIYERLRYLKTEIENHKQNQQVELYNSASVSYNKAVNQFNDYINYYNKQFTPNRKDAEIREMIEAPERNLHDVRTKLSSIENASENIGELSKELLKAAEMLAERVKEQKEWVDKYLGKSKILRKSMFYKYSIMGVPVN